MSWQRAVARTWGWFADPDLDNLDAVRNALRDPDYDMVRMRCYNRDEAKFVYDRLSDAERARVIFVWWTFGLPEEGRPL
jgi:hypothetical protein